MNFKSLYERAVLHKKAKKKASNEDVEQIDHTASVASAENEEKTTSIIRDKKKTSPKYRGCQ